MPVDVGPLVVMPQQHDALAQFLPRSKYALLAGFVGQRLETLKCDRLRFHRQALLLMPSTGKVSTLQDFDRKTTGKIPPRHGIHAPDFSLVGRSRIASALLHEKTRFAASRHGSQA